MEALSIAAESEQTKVLAEIIKSTNCLMDTVKHAVILLQMANARVESTGSGKADDDTSDISDKAQVIRSMLLVFTFKK